MGRRAAVAAVGPRAVAGDGSDDAGGRVDRADSLAPHVGDIDRAIRSNRQPARTAQETGAGRLPVVDARAAKRSRDESSLPVVAPQPARAVAPKDRAVRIGPDARFA